MPTFKAYKTELKCSLNLPNNIDGNSPLKPNKNLKDINFKFLPSSICNLSHYAKTLGNFKLI